jgi:hypothetical protein
VTTYSTVALSLAVALLSISHILMARQLRRLEIQSRRIQRTPRPRR